MINLIYILAILFSSIGFAKTAIVKKHGTALRTRPNHTAKIIKKLSEGTKLKIIDNNNGFFQVKSNSRKKSYILIKHVIVIKEDDTNNESTQMPETESPNFFDRITYDFNVGSRLQNESISIEAAFGLNFHFLSWLSIREAVFYHKLANSDNSLGLDSSLRGSYRVGGDHFSMTPTIGAGYRIETLREGVPFAEGGLRLNIGGGLSIGLSAKRLFYSVIDKNRADETVFSVGGNFAGVGRIL